MIKERVVVIYADTWDDLCVKMLGWYHDHCWHYYNGLTENVPKDLQEFIEEDKKYVFLCEEDEPYIPKEALEGLWEIFEKPKLDGRVSSSPKTNRDGRK